MQVDLKHINTERGRNITETEAKEFVENAVLSIRVWGNYERYFAYEGAAYVDVVSDVIRTAFRKDQYNEKNMQMMEVCRRYGL